MRVPLSWLRDFAPFDGDPAALAAALDDLGLVVEEVVRVGEGLADVVVARVESIEAIEGADRIRRVVVDAGAGPVEVVCGASNFGTGDLVPFAPVGAVLPGGFAIGRRTMKGVVSNGMLCSGRELDLTDDHAGLLVLNDVAGARAGRRLAETLGVEPDVVFDLAVEANRPDAWSVAGVARDLAARMGVPFEIPARIVGSDPSHHPAVPVDGRPSAPSTGAPVETLASLDLQDTELCPRFTATVFTDVVVGPSPAWVARRLTLAGMRPINNVVDASNYVMIELGQPTHPYDLDRLPGHGLVVRGAAAGEEVTTLDGVRRELGRPGPGLDDPGRDCVICDADGTPVGLGGLMGGASSEITAATTRVLLEAAYFMPMAIARTSKKLALRTEASARFERGVDPEGIDRAVARFTELLGAFGGPAVAVSDGTLDARGAVPAAVRLPVRVERVNALLGAGFTGEEITGLLAPLGIAAAPRDDRSGSGDRTGVLDVTVPTFRPDIRPAPMGEADIAEEVARTYGYSRLARRHPAWPQPGRLTAFQRERRTLREILVGLGASEAWTTTFVTAEDQELAGFRPPFVEIANPLVDAERCLRSSMAPGLVRAVLHNAERRQGEVRLFEVGTVFAVGAPPGNGSGPSSPPVETERLSAVFCGAGDDAWTAVAGWHVIASSLRLAGWSMDDREEPAAGVLHPYRQAVLCARSTAGDGAPTVVARNIGVVGELDPSVVRQLGLVGRDGRPRRVGWLDLDLGVLLDHGVTPRAPDRALPISKFPTADVDLAFVVDAAVPAGAVEEVLRRAGGGSVESVALFDVYRGEPLDGTTRSLAYRIRFCATDHTLDEEELAGLRQRCIDAVARHVGATLR